MVVGKHGVFRSIDTDDAPFVLRLFDPDRPIASLLNQSHEYLVPTLDEVTHLLSGTGPKGLSSFNVIETRSGEIRGFCALRAATDELFPGRFDMMFFNEDDFPSPLAEEAARFLLEEAFLRKGLKRIVSQCLDSENALRALLIRHGFTSNGIQREVLYGGGRWFSIESLSLALSDATARLTAPPAH